MYKHQPVWDALRADVEMMKQVKISDLHGHELLGRPIGAKVLTPRQIPGAYQEWDRPTIEDFVPRTLWSLYNAVNAALKTSPVSEIMERHRLLHQTIVDLH
jgi:hypothetical protein